MIFLYSQTIRLKRPPMRIILGPDDMHSSIPMPVTAIRPVRSIGIIDDKTSGIEPLFSHAIKRAPATPMTDEEFVRHLAQSEPTIRPVRRGHDSRPPSRPSS